MGLSHQTQAREGLAGVLAGLVALILTVFSLVVPCGEARADQAKPDIVKYEVNNEDDLESCVTIASSEGGTIVLTADITLTKRLVIPARYAVKIDLKGRTLKRSLESFEPDGNVIYVEKEGELDIVDTSPKGSGKITGGRANNGGGILNKGTLNLTGGTIVDCEAQYCGGGIHNSGTMTITSTWIEKCSATGGGGIYNQGTAAVGAKNIQDNEATDIGGGILNDAVMTVTRATVRRNTAREAGGIANRIVSGPDMATLDVIGCTVTANTATFAVGGIYGTRYIWDASTEAKGTQHKGKVTISGNTKITNNTSPTIGGVGIDYGVSLALNGATLTGNNSTSAIWLAGLPTSGGISFCGKANQAHKEPTAEFTIEGKNIVKNNKCAGVENNLMVSGDDRLVVTGPFTAGTSIGLTTFIGPIWEFTTDFSTHNEKPASTYFFNRQNLSVKDRGGEAAFVEPVPFVDENGEDQVTDEYNLADGSAGAYFNGGTYVSYRDARVDERIYATGDVRLILCDGTRLTLSKGLEIKNAASEDTLTHLHILGQGQGDGKLECEAEAGQAALGFNESAYAYLSVHAGDIFARGGKGGAGIGTGSKKTDRCIVTVTVYGGTINAQGGSKAAGIGSGSAGGCTMNFIVLGGEVVSNGLDGAAGIGGTTGAYAGVHAEFLGGTTYAASSHEGAAAVGAGAGGNDNATIVFGEAMSVHANGGNAAAGEREEALRTSIVAIIEPCTHKGEAYTLIDDQTHRVSCLYCDIDKRVESHWMASDHTCGCGYKQPTHTITYDPAGGRGEKVVSEPAYEGETIVLSDHNIWQPNGLPPSGKWFKYWEVDGIRSDPGDELTLTSDVTAKAIWDTACRLRFAAGAGYGKTITIIAAKGSEVALPEPTFQLPQDKGFSGWEMKGKLYRVGDTITVTGNMDFTATYGMNWRMLQEAINSISGQGTIQLTNDVYATATDTALLIPVGKDVTIDLNGYTIDRNLTTLANDGYCALVRGSLTVNDTSAGQTGLITGANNANVFRGRGNELLGGGVCVDGGTLTLNGGAIANNESADGAGVQLVRSSSTFRMNGGSVSDNVASEFGGGIHVAYGSTLKITGGEITGNVVSGSSDNIVREAGAGIYAQSSFEIEGSPRIADNTAGDGQASNVYLANKNWRVRVTGKLTPPVPIGIATQEPWPITRITDGLASKGLVTDFVADNPEQIVAPDGDEAVMKKPKTIAFDAGGEDVEGEMEGDTMAYGLAYKLPDCAFVSRNHRAFRAWTIEGRAYEAGSDYMPTKDVTATATWDDTYEVTFDAGEGTGSLESAYVVCGGTYQLPDTCPFEEPLGGTFLGWEVAGELYGPGAEIVVGQPITARCVYDLTWAGLQALLDGEGDVDVVLPHDLTATATDGPLTVSVPKEITIDLNGHTLDRAGARMLSPNSAEDASLRAQATSDAGAVFDLAADGVTLTIKDDTAAGIVTGASGAAVFAGDGRADVTLEGVSVTDNEVRDGISEVAGTLAMENASVHDNQGVTCGGIHVGACSLTCAANARIFDNTVDGEPSNVRLAPGATITVEGLIGQEEPLGVASDAKPTKDAPVQLTSELFGYGDETSFACEEGPYLVTVAADEEAYLVLPARVTIEKAGGTGEMTVEELPMGMSYPLPDCTLTPPRGKVFDGWVCAMGDGTAPQKLAPETKVELLGDLTLTPAWVDHDHQITQVLAKAPTCTEPGLIDHWTCTGPDGGCGRVFADKDGTTELDESDVVIPTTEHVPDVPVIESLVEATADVPASWDEVTYCSVCGNELSRIHKVEGEDEPGDHVCVPKEPIRTDEVAATCEEGGSYIEVVSCAVCGKELSRQRRATDPLGHDWSEPTYAWTELLDSVTATRVCLRDATHVETETVETETYPKPISDSARELVTFTATFANPAFGTVSREKLVETAGDETNDGQDEKKDAKGGQKSESGDSKGTQSDVSVPINRWSQGYLPMMPWAGMYDPFVAYPRNNSGTVVLDSDRVHEDNSSPSTESTAGYQGFTAPVEVPPAGFVASGTPETVTTPTAGVVTQQVQMPSTGKTQATQAPSTIGSASTGSSKVTSAPLSATADETPDVSASAACGLVAVAGAAGLRLRRKSRA